MTTQSYVFPSLRDYAPRESGDAVITIKDVMNSIIVDVPSVSLMGIVEGNPTLFDDTGYHLVSGRQFAKVMVKGGLWLIKKKMVQNPRLYVGKNSFDMPDSRYVADDGWFENQKVFLSDEEKVLSAAVLVYATVAEYCKAGSWPSWIQNDFLRTEETYMDFDGLVRLCLGLNEARTRLTFKGFRDDVSDPFLRLAAGRRIPQ